MRGSMRKPVPSSGFRIPSPQTLCSCQKQLRSSLAHIPNTNSVHWPTEQQIDGVALRFSDNFRLAVSCVETTARLALLRRQALRLHQHPCARERFESLRFKCPSVEHKYCSPTFSLVITSTDCACSSGLFFGRTFTIRGWDFSMSTPWRPREIEALQRAVGALVG